MRKAGRHFLQIPGPSAVPDRILSAIGQQTIDHRGPDFAKVGLRALDGLKTIFKTEEHVFIYPASGTGAWEAALVNTLSPGDRVLMFETGHFATLWKKLAEKLGLKAEFIEGDWRGGADPDQIEAYLAEDKAHADQGGLRRAQRNLDRIGVADRRGAQGHRQRQVIRRFSWSIRSRVWPRSTTGMMNGASMLPYRARKRG